MQICKVIIVCVPCTWLCIKKAVSYLGNEISRHTQRNENARQEMRITNVDVAAIVMGRKGVDS